MRIIGFNGPPRSGKDSIGHALAAIIEDKCGVQPMMLALSQPMRETIYALMGTTYSVTHYERYKDEPQACFNGKSIRQAMISLSESHCKPTYGHDFWNRSALNRIESWMGNGTRPACVIITDYGFPHEPQFFEQVVGDENHFLARITRAKHLWNNDSRSWVEANQMRMFYNDGTISDTARRVYGHLMNQLHWTF